MKSSRVGQLADRLIAWRRKNGISLSDVAEATKISPRYLDAIEHERFCALPGGVYGLNYIRQYARAIHYAEDEILKSYWNAVGAEVVPAPPVRAATLAGRVLGRLRKASHGLSAWK